MTWEGHMLYAFPLLLGSSNTSSVISLLLKVP